MAALGQDQWVLLELAGVLSQRVRRLADFGPFHSSWSSPPRPKRWRSRPRPAKIILRQVVPLGKSCWLRVASRVSSLGATEDRGDHRCRADRGFDRPGAAHAEACLRGGGGGA